MNAKHQIVSTRYWRFTSLVTVIALAVMLLAGHSLIQAQDPGGNDPSRTLSIPLGSTGLAFGQGLRATLTNLGNRSVEARIRVLDEKGAALKEEAIVLEPNQMRAVTISRSEVGGDDSSVLVRAEAQVAQADAAHLWLTGEVIDQSTGSTRFVTTGGRTPSELVGSNLNHNETLLSDNQ